MRDSSDDLLNRIQLLEKVYVLAKKDADKPALNRYFSVEKVGALLGFDKLQALELSDQLASRDLAVKQTLPNNRVGIKLAPKGVQAIENMQKQKQLKHKKANEKSKHAKGKANKPTASAYMIILVGVTLVVFVGLSFMLGLF